jgi:hypothetical protein
MAEHPLDSLRHGADAFHKLLAAIRDVNNQTCDQLGEEVDGRDYVTVADLIKQSIRKNFTACGGMHREGYLRAMTDTLARVADICSPSSGDESLATTEASFAMQRLANSAPLNASLDQQEAAKVERRSDERHDIYTGNAAGIVEAGLLEVHQLPGQFGRPKTQACYWADGTQKMKGSNYRPNGDWDTGKMTVKRLKVDWYRVTVKISEEEFEARNSRARTSTLMAAISEASTSICLTQRHTPHTGLRLVHSSNRGSLP